MIRQLPCNLKVRLGLPHRVDRLIPEQVIVSPKPGTHIILSLPVGCRREKNVCKSRCRIDEMVLNHHEIQTIQGLNTLIRIGHLVERIGADHIEKLKIPRVPSFFPQQDRVPEFRVMDLMPASE